MKSLGLLALALLLTVSLGARERSFAGRAPQPDGVAAWKLVLVLRDNGNAVLNTAKSSINNSIENAVWTKTADGGISVQFLNRSGRPRGEPLVMTQDGGVLTPATWDKASWGEVGPPELRLAASAW